MTKPISTAFDGATFYASTELGTAPPPSIYDPACMGGPTWPCQDLPVQFPDEVAQTGVIRHHVPGGGG